jgi:CRP/FNR family transcriptional regulator, cyclic AMP receptor protein
MPRGFYGGLSPEARNRLNRLGRMRSYHPGQIVYSRDAPSTHVRVLMEGSVKLTASSPGSRETLLEIRTPGDLLGEREVLYGTDSTVVADSGSGVPQPRSPVPGSQGRPSATATALQPTRALVVPAAQFARFMATEPDAMAAIARDLESRLSETQLRLGGIASENANRRLARALLQLSMRTALPGVEQTWLQLSQGELASWIGVSRETVERILGDWRGRGIIETGYRRVVVLRLDDLMRIAGARPVARPEVSASLRGLR